MRAALVLAKLQNSTHRFVVGDDHRFDDGLFDLADVDGVGKFRGTVDFDNAAIGARDAVTHARGCGDQVKPEFTLQPLLHNFHVQQAEKTAAKAETEGHGIFRLVEKCRVVQFQFTERVAQRLVFIGEYRK